MKRGKKPNNRTQFVKKINIQGGNGTKTWLHGIQKTIILGFILTYSVETKNVPDRMQ